MNTHRDTKPRDRDRIVATGLTLTATTVSLVALALASEGTVQVVSIAALGLLVLIVATAFAAIHRHSVAGRLAALDAELQHERDTNQELNRLFARFSDELRTPLTSVYRLSRNLESARVSDATESEELIQILSRDATEIARAVENAALAAQIDTGTYRPRLAALRLDRHVTRIIEALGRAPIEIAIDVHEATAWCDPAAIRLVLLNVLHTAVAGGASTARIDVDERNGLGILSITDDRQQGPVPDGTPGELLGAGDNLSQNIVSALVESQGGTMNSARTLGWSNTVIRLPLATTVQLSGSNGATFTTDSSRTT